MDKRVLNLAKQIVVLLEPKSTAVVKPVATVKPVAAVTPRPKTKAVGTFAKLPKNKQAYLTKKQKECRKIFKRDWNDIPEKDVTRYIKAVTDNAMYFALTYTPKPSMKLWKEYVDEEFEKLVEVESDYDDEE